MTRKNKMKWFLFLIFFSLLLISSCTTEVVENVVLGACLNVDFSVRPYRVDVCYESKTPFILTNFEDRIESFEALVHMKNGTNKTILINKSVSSRSILQFHLEIPHKAYIDKIQFIPLINFTPYYKEKIKDGAILSGDCNKKVFISGEEICNY